MSEAFATAETTKVVGEATHVHIDVHVHLNGVVDLAPVERRREPRDIEIEIDRPRATAQRSRHPLLKNAAIVAAVAAVGFVGFRAGNVASQQQATSAAATGAPPPAALASSTPSLPESLARELQRPPQVTPPPGASIGAGTSGPSAFGLER